MLIISVKFIFSRITINQRKTERRNSYEENRHKEKEKLSEDLKVQDSEPCDINEKLLMDCSFVSDSPLDDEVQDNTIENMEIIEKSEKSESTNETVNDNASDNTEVAIAKPTEFTYENLPKVNKTTNKNMTSDESELIPPPLSLIKSPGQSFQIVKKSRKEKKTAPKIDFKF